MNILNYKQSIYIPTYCVYQVKNQINIPIYACATYTKNNNIETK